MPVQIMVLNTPQKRLFVQLTHIKPAPKDSLFEHPQLSIIVHLPYTYMTGITSVL